MRRAEENFGGKNLIYTPDRITNILLNVGCQEDAPVKRNPAEFEKFDKVMSGLLAVPYSELQKKLEQEKKEKAKHKKPNGARSAKAKTKHRQR